MDKLREDIRTATRADEIMNDPLVRMALDGMRENLKSGFSAQSRYNQEQSHEMWLTLKVIDKFEQFLKATIDNGKLAEHEIERISWLEKQKRRFTK
jgi:light-regulated signal transduction histidine kinase (bacteriophytochrome)